MSSKFTLRDLILYREAQVATALDRELERPAPDWKRADRLARRLIYIKAAWLLDGPTKRTIDKALRKAYIAA